MSSIKVIYLDRFGLKVYNITSNLSVLEKEIKSLDIDQIKPELVYLNGQSVLLLLADAVSYFYEKIIDPPLKIDNSFKNSLKEIIKSEIPEDFSDFNWDYKVEKDVEDKQKITIFAPIKEFQSLISEISNQLNIKIKAIENQTSASIRDPDPVIGITKKADIKGKDEEVLNLSIIPTVKKNKNIPKIISIVIFFILIAFTVFFIIKAIPKKTSQITDSTPIISQIPTETPTPTPTIKDWTNLNIIVQNGTSKAGLASKTALIFKNSGVNQVETGNADNDNYISNKLIFKDDLLKENYQNKFKELIKINDENITIDNYLKNDAILILGLN